MWLTKENTQNYDNFVSFGGWVKPACKYITKYTQECGMYFYYLYS